MRKKKKVSVIPSELSSGEILWAKNDFFLTCCDCGLRHHVTVDKEVKRKERITSLKPNDKWLALRFYRDDRLTKLHRQEEKIRIVKAHA